MKRYVIIAGVNGAGKSTLYQVMDSLKNMSRINTDEIVREFGDWKNSSDVIRAGKIAVSKINHYFEIGESFNQESTLCGRSIIKSIKRARMCGYRIELHYVGVDSVDIAKKRIAQRVANGGHGIPDKDVERRYVESLGRLPEVIQLVDIAILYDNSCRFDRFAVFEYGKLKTVENQQPFWWINMCELPLTEQVHTIEEIYALPEEKRAELIDGQIYETEPPSILHQRISIALANKIADYIDSKKGNCKVFPAPLAVFLNNDNTTYVEPDISVICDNNKIDDRGCNGAPDMAIEIVSKSSQHMDYLIKLFKYRTAGVREYWIVNPMKRTVLVYIFGENEDSTQYVFEDDIPVGIYSDLTINLSELLN